MSDEIEMGIKRMLIAMHEAVNGTNWLCRPTNLRGQAAVQADQDEAAFFDAVQKRLQFSILDEEADTASARHKGAKRDSPDAHSGTKEGAPSFAPPLRKGWESKKLGSPKSKRKQKAKSSMQRQSPKPRSFPKKKRTKRRK